MKHRKHIVGSIVLVSNYGTQYAFRVTGVTGDQIEGIRQIKRTSQYEIFRDASGRLGMVDEKHVIEILQFP